MVGCDGSHESYAFLEVSRKACVLSSMEVLARGCTSMGIAIGLT